ncbi:transmembrane protein 187 [Xenopus tropicalis]|uniref:Transmembrane protein 187 n=1 Tax=Xenopus tropicalis TaxID=8364 RepID=A0A803KBR4_XENTR|nr:transmembrane protein 187 [Xenopus tropicalis]|eukprot:XP_004916779.1 PREDICTED: transmembrane protein 187 [Xenopus tropicalis]
MDFRMASTLHKEKALWHVAAACTVCLLTVNTGMLDGVSTELGYSHYAEKPVSWVPSFLAMPCNSMVNLGYILVGGYWRCQDNKSVGMKEQTGQYLKNIFSWMALIYGPVQWARIWTQSHYSAVLDQWFTLPIFSWACIWCNAILEKWSMWQFLAVELFSFASYFLSLLHPQGFEVALAAHIIWAIVSGLRAQSRYGDALSMRYLALALTSCLGFVGLKLLDHWLAQWFVFQRFTGHFWSKLCDILQFHYAFCFLTHLSQKQHFRKKK